MTKKYVYRFYVGVGGQSLTLTEVLRVDARHRLNRVFGGSTLYKAEGSWKDEVEPTDVWEAVGETADEEATLIAHYLCGLFAQKAVLVTKQKLEWAKEVKRA